MGGENLIFKGKHMNLYCDNRFKDITNEEFSLLLSENFNVDSSLVKDNTLILMFLCSYISVDELSYYFSIPKTGVHTLYSQLKKMEKTGIVKNCTITPKDGLALRYWYLSEDGFMLVASMFRDGVYEQYKRRGKKQIVVHDYSLGLNLIHLLLYKKPFTWQKEVTWGIGKQKGNVCIDGVCTFEDNKRLFFEQDMGNEPNSTLIGKLVLYHNNKLMDNPSNDTLVFSFRKPHISVSSEAYSLSNITELIDFMEPLHIESVNAAYKELIRDDIDRAGGFNKELLLKTSKKILISNGCIDTKGNELKLFSFSSLLNYREEIKSMRSDVRMADINKGQYSFCKQKTHSLIGILNTTLSTDEHRFSSCLISMYKGFSAYCFPTNLVSNYLYTIYELKDKIYESIKGYCKGLDYNSYEEISTVGPVTQTGTTYSLYMRHCFRYGEETMSCEYGSRDLGGYIRIKKLLEIQPLSLSCICIVDDYDDALFLSNPTQFGKESIPFILLDDLGKEKSLFIVNKEGKITHI